MLKPEDKDYYLPKVLNSNLSYLTRKQLRKQILEKAKKTTQCYYCKEVNGIVKKAGMLKIVHEKYKKSGKKPEKIIEEMLQSDYSYAIEHNKEIQTILQNSGLVYTLNPVQVRFKHYFEFRNLNLFKFWKLFISVNVT